VKILALGFVSWVCFGWCGLALGQETAPPKPTPPAGEQQQTQPPAQPQTPPAQTPAPASQPAPSPGPHGGYDPAETPLSIEIFGFLPHAHPDLLGGKKATDQTAQSFRDLGKTRTSEGVLLSIPVGKGNKLDISGFLLRGRGSGIAPQAITLFGSTFAKNDLISDNYSLRDFKISFNYLSYPAPPGDSKFRFRTLYEIQYTSFRSRYSSQSEASEISAIGNKYLFLPTFGIAIEYLASKNFHIEMKGSGFGFPHKSATADAEATAVIRAGRLDVIVGGKGFYFKTSTNSDHYFRSTLYGPFAALRYRFR